jgi:hypothetical protein
MVLHFSSTHFVTSLIWLEEGFAAGSEQQVAITLL